MPEIFDPRKATTAFDHVSTLVVVLELSGRSWVVGASVPGVSRRPLRQLTVGELGELSRTIEQWREQAARAGAAVSRVVIGYEAGQDGFWIARTLQEQGFEVHVMHPASIAVERSGRRALAAFVGLTGTPFASGGSHREQGISKNGNPRVRRMITQLTWRWLMFQSESVLAQWFHERTAGAKGRIRTIMAIALAR